MKQAVEIRAAERSPNQTTGGHRDSLQGQRLTAAHKPHVGFMVFLAGGSLDLSIAKPLVPDQQTKASWSSRGPRFPRGLRRLLCDNCCAEWLSRDSGSLQSLLLSGFKENACVPWAEKTAYSEPMGAVKVRWLTIPSLVTRTRCHQRVKKSGEKQFFCSDETVSNLKCHQGCASPDLVLNAHEG